MRQTPVDRCHSETHKQTLTAHHNDKDLDLCPFLLPRPVCVCAVLSHIKSKDGTKTLATSLAPPFPLPLSLSVCVDMCLVVAAATLPNWGCHRLLRPGQREREG